MHKEKTTVYKTHPVANTLALVILSLTTICTVIGAITIIRTVIDWLSN